MSRYISSTFEGAWRIVTRNIALDRLAHEAEPDTLSLPLTRARPNDINIEEALEKHRAITRPPPATLSYPQFNALSKLF